MAFPHTRTKLPQNCNGLTNGIRAPTDAPDALGQRAGRRPIMPAEVAALGIYLCGDAAANITGTALPIDGAWAVG